MPRRKRFIFKAFLPLGLLAVAVLALVRRRGDDWEYEQAEPLTEDAPIAPVVSRRRPAARFAYAAAFTTLFFAGASFTAGAGDQTARLMDEDAAALAELGDVAAGVEPTTVEAAPAEAAPVEAAPVEAAPVEAAEGYSVPVEAEPAVAAEPAPVAAAPVAAAPEAAVAESVAVASDTAYAQSAAPVDAAASNIVAPAPAKPTDVRAAATPAAAKPAKPRTPTKQWVVKRAGRGARRRARDRARGRPWRADDLAQPCPPRSDACIGAARTLVRQGSRSRLEAPRRRLGSCARRAPGAGEPDVGARDESRAQHAGRAARRQGHMEGRAGRVQPDDLRRPCRGTRRPVPVGRDRSARDRPRGREGSPDRSAARRRERVDLRLGPRGSRGRSDRRPRRSSCSATSPSGTIR